MKSPLDNNEISAAGHRQRIRQRFIDYGSDFLAEYEKLELFLTLCIPRKDVKPLAKTLLKEFGSINAVLNASDSALLKIKGIGESLICNIKILRMCMEASFIGEVKKEPVSLDSVDLLLKYFERRLAPLEYEVLEMICLDSQLRLIGDGSIRIFTGNIASVNIDVRKIIEIAFKKSAHSIVLAHNHPNAPASPSKEDIVFTKNLSDTCRTLKLDFIEHLIIAPNSYFSFRRNGHLDLLYDSSALENINTKVASPRKTLKD